MNNQKLKSELCQALERSKNNPKLSGVIKDIGSKNIIIYGAGYAGRYACDILMKNELTPLCFLDMKGEALGAYAGIPIRTMEHSGLSDAEIENSMVVFCVLSDDEKGNGIIKSLNSFGFKNTISYKQKAFSNDFLERNLSYEEPSAADFQHKILSCFDLFADEKSVETYRNNLVAFASRCFDRLPFMNNEQQYFPEDIPFSKGYSHFVDCGAFDGDTIAALISNKGIPETIIAFEPDQQNFDALSRKMNDYKTNECYLFPCGVSSKTEALRFKSDLAYSGLASSIDQHGDCIIQCVAIDDVLKGKSPTFIKMDIEGAEYDGLIGARNIISKYKPDLAICVYHYLNHYFEIPLLVDSWNLGYKFYLRTYDSQGNETVMYATTR